MGVTVSQMRQSCSLILGKKFDIYCRVPMRRGLQQTARAATRHGARDPKNFNKKQTAHLIRLFYYDRVSLARHNILYHVTRLHIC